MREMVYENKAARPPQENKAIAVAEPTLDGNEEAYLLDALRSTRLSMGKYVGKLERAFIEATTAFYALACSNGTAALHLAVAALGAKAGDEVIVPALTFVATANAVSYTGATPVFVDVDPLTWTIDPESVARAITPRTVGIIAVHLYGHPADMDAIGFIAKSNPARPLWVIEDAAQALGASVRGEKVGSIGDAATFSLYGNKLVTCGEGGVVTTSQLWLANKMARLRGQGMDPSRRYWHDTLGYNYRLTDLQAAVGVAQLENLDRRLAERQQVVYWYDRCLRGMKVRMQYERVGYTSAHWMVTVLLDERVDRDKVAARLAEQGIETRPVFHPLHTLPMYAAGQQLSVAEYVAHHGLTLPTHGKLTLQDVERVCGVLGEALGCSAL